MLGTIRDWHKTTIYKSIKNTKYSDKKSEEMKDLYTEKYKTWLREIKDLNEEIDLVHGMEDSALLRFNSSNISYWSR